MRPLTGMAVIQSGSAGDPAAGRRPMSATTFIYNAWYVAGWDREVTTEPRARTLLNQPVVLYRTQDGKPVALEDRCCHRHFPLSLGKCVGDAIQCGYHGLRFDPAGNCIEIPGQSMIPR